MLMRNQNGIGAVESARLAPHARVDDQDPAVGFKADAPVG